MTNTGVTTLIEVKDLGLIDYSAAYDLQKRYVKRTMNEGQPALLLCEHPPVLTLGRLADEKSLLFPQEDLEKKGIKILKIDRGGDVTLHAPGQLVIYPVFNLNNLKKDLHYFIHSLEQLVIDLLNDFDIVAKRINGKTGVWIREKKLASIGIGVKRWITFHGVAINVNTDLNLFSMIKPCGLDVEMTSISKLKGYLVDMEKVKYSVIKHCTKIFPLT